MNSIDPKWIRGKVDEVALDQGCYFDADAGAYTCEFLERYCRQSQGTKWDGKPLILMDYQRDFLMRLYSWKRPDRTRRYRTAYLEVPKKNGKSTKVSGIALYGLVADGEPAAQIYINAYNRGQATIIFDEAARMVAKSPALSKILDVIRSSKRIVHEASNSKIVALSKDAPAQDGLNSSLTIFDELHRQRTPELWEIFEFAGAARTQPLLLSITTAGYDRESICWRQHEYSERVNAGEILDTAHLGVIYGATIDDDWEDPAVWRKANPGLGITISEEDFAAEVAKVKEVPSALNNFLRLRLNIWTQANHSFISRSSWDACGTEIDESRLAGKACWGGLDLSTTTDLTAFALVFESGEILVRFFLPDADIVERENVDRVPYRDWARRGFLFLTPGNVIDYEFVRSQINADAAKFSLQKIYTDPFNATQICLTLRDQDGIKVEFLRQGYISLSPPTKELERLILSKKIAHGSNPILTNHALNAQAIQDAAGNLKLSKAASAKRIDGIAAVINAIAARSSDGNFEKKPSVYESRGLLFL